MPKQYFYLLFSSTNFLFCLVFIPLRCISKLFPPAEYFLNCRSLSNFQFWVFPLIFDFKGFYATMYFPQDKFQRGVSSFFHLSLSVFLQVYYTFLKSIFPTASLFIFSSSVYFAATSSYNVILPIMIISPSSVAYLRENCKLWVQYYFCFLQRVFSCENVIFFAVNLTLLYYFASNVFSYDDSSSL